MQFLGTSSKRAFYFLKHGWVSSLPYTRASIARLQATNHALIDGGEPVILSVADDALKYNFLSPAHLQLFEVDQRPLTERLQIYNTELSGIVSGLVQGLDTVQKNVVNAIQVGQGDKDAGISQSLHDVSDKVKSQKQQAKDRETRAKENAAHARGKQEAIQYWSAKPRPLVRPQNPFKPNQTDPDAAHEHAAWNEGWDEGEDQVATDLAAQKRMKSAATGKPAGKPNTPQMMQPKRQSAKPAAPKKIKPAAPKKIKPVKHPTGFKPTVVKPRKPPKPHTPHFKGTKPTIRPTPKRKLNKMPLSPPPPNVTSKPKIKAVASTIPTINDIKRASDNESRKMTKLDQHIEQIHKLHNQLKQLRKHNLLKLAKMLKVKAPVKQKVVNKRAAY